MEVTHCKVCGRDFSQEEPLSCCAISRRSQERAERLREYRATLPKSVPAKCLTPYCEVIIGGEFTTVTGGGRGVCKKCHSKYSQLIKKGKTTWAELVELGLARLIKGRPRTALMDTIQFLRDKKKQSDMGET
jgi:hypothetical protein